MAAVKLDNKGQIQIPEEIRRRHGWGEGTELEVIERENQLTLVPVECNGEGGVRRRDDALSMREFLDRYAGSADGGLTTDEVMAMTRGDD